MLHPSIHLCCERRRVPWQVIVCQSAGRENCAKKTSVPWGGWTGETHAHSHVPCAATALTPSHTRRPIFLSPIITKLSELQETLIELQVSLSSPPPQKPIFNILSLLDCHSALTFSNSPAFMLQAPEMLSKNSSNFQFNNWGDKIFHPACVVTFAG